MGKLAAKLLMLSVAIAFSAIQVDAVPRWAKHQKHHHKKLHRHVKRHARRAGLPPAVVVQVHTASQHVTVDVEGQRYGDWLTSTARRGYITPHGHYRAIRMARVYFSKKYDNSPMPNSVFFHGGYAIHGTYHIKGLGRPASHGCVRLLPAHAAELYSLVERYGMSRTQIVVTN